MAHPPVPGPGWRRSSPVNGGGQTLGSGGFASNGVTLLAWLPMAELDGSANGSSCWGYTSPSGREYGIIGTEGGTCFVEITNPTHPQVIMVDRISKEVKEKSSGRIEVQSFPNGQLGSGRDMTEAVASGALTFTTDGAAALGQFLPQLSVIEAPYLWRDAAHMAKVGDSPIFEGLNKDLVAKRGMRMLAVTYYGSAISRRAASRSAPSATWRASSCASRRSIPSAPWRKPGGRAPRR